MPESDKLVFNLECNKSLNMQRHREKKVFQCRLKKKISTLEMPREEKPSLSMFAD